MRTEEDSQLDIQSLSPETGKLENKIPLIVIRLFVFHVSLKVYCCLAKFLRCGRLEDGGPFKWHSFRELVPMEYLYNLDPSWLGIPVCLIYLTSKAFYDE